MTYNKKIGIAFTFFKLNGVFLLLFVMLSYWTDIETTFGLIAVLGMLFLPLMVLLFILLLMGIIISFTIRPQNKMLITLSTAGIVYIVVIVFSIYVDIGQFSNQILLALSAIYAILCVSSTNIPVSRPNKAN